MGKKDPNTIVDLRSVSTECQKAAMAAARAQFPRDNPCGVIAMEIGPKRKRGNKVAPLTLVVYVERKLSEPLHHVPMVHFEFEGKRFVIAPDVVAVGRRFRPHYGWMSLFTGLHPGAQIIVDLQRQLSVGAVSLLFHTEGMPQYLVTAGHLFPPNSEGLPVKAASRSSEDSFEVGRIIFNLLDGAYPPLDVAVVQLNSNGVNLAIDTAKSADSPRLASTVPMSNLAGIEGQAFLPIEHQYSMTTMTNQYLFTGYMDGEVRGSYEITDVLQTDRPITQEGDSGTALFSAQFPMVGIGTCIGVLGQSTLVEQFDRSLRIIRQRIGRPIYVWHGDQFGGEQ